MKTKNTLNFNFEKNAPLPGAIGESGREGFPAKNFPKERVFCGQGGKTADWLLISRVILLSADLSATAQQSLKNCEFFTSVTQQIQQEMQK